MGCLLKKDLIMRLSYLIASSEDVTRQGQDVDIVGVTDDSRKIAPGFLFIAIPGTKLDGRIFMEDVINRGAVAVLAPDGTMTKETNITLVTSSDIRKTVSSIAAKFYPRQPEMMAAVTGTSGK